MVKCNQVNNDGVNMIKKILMKASLLFATLLLSSAVFSENPGLPGDTSTGTIVVQLSLAF